MNRCWKSAIFRVEESTSNENADDLIVEFLLDSHDDLLVFLAVLLEIMVKDFE